MTHSRNKGASGERELAGLIHDHLGVRMVRNLEQSRAGGHDLVVHETSTGTVADRLREFAPEVKRHRRATETLRQTWWTQACEQAAVAGLLPLLAYREDRAAWRLVLPLAQINPELPDDLVADLDLPAFCAVVRDTAPIQSRR